jgi:D-psicose/D-tagatose/L-ribulose 3-epimerase
MIKACVHLMTWTSVIDKKTPELFPKIKEMGYDGVEIPFIDPFKMDSSLVNIYRKELEKNNLGCVCGAGMGKSNNLIDDDLDIRQKGIDFVKRSIEVCSDLGSNMICGVLYGTFEMSKGRARTQTEWDRAVELIQKLADYAAEKNVTLNLEVINRYESYFLNTAEDGMKLLKDINKKNVKIHLDTYHMNIEEKNFYDPIVLCGSSLGYLHCSENDRGVVGSGHINWDEIFKGLARIHYNGWIGTETFYAPIDFIPVASSVWRKLAENLDDVPKNGLIYLRKKIQEYGLDT